MSEDVDDDAVDRIETDRLCCETANGGVAGVAGVAGNDGLFDADLFVEDCLLYTSPSPRDGLLSRMPSSA